MQNFCGTSEETAVSYCGKGVGIRGGTILSRTNVQCRLLRVKELELFGSATRDDFSPDSDIDVLVTFEGREQLFSRYFDLTEGLEQIFGRRVDVVMPEAIANPIFREHIAKERTVVYGA